MKSEIKLIREISYPEGEHPIEGVPPQKIEVTIDGDATIYELLQLFDQFLKGAGYYPPEASILDYVSDDFDEERFARGCDCGCDGDVDGANGYTGQ